MRSKGFSKHHCFRRSITHESTRSTGLLQYTDYRCAFANSRANLPGMHMHIYSLAAATVMDKGNPSLGVS